MIKVYNLIIFICTFLFFTSCQNFFNCADLKNEIENKVKYEKSTPINVRIASNNDNIKFLSGTSDFTLKQTDNKVIEFELDIELYEFNGWKVYQKDNKENDCSKNVTIKVTQNGNVFTTKIELLSAAVDLVLEAQISRLPGVISAEPLNTTAGVLCYRPIKITFATPMNPSDLSDFDNIKITDGAGADISYLFNSPVLSEDGLLLTIKPDQAKIVEKIPLGKTLKIEVTLSNAIRENQERNTKFSGYSFYYKACNVEDEKKPSINSFSITRNLFDFDSMTSYSKELSKKSFEDLGAVTEQDFQEQLVSDSLFIKVNATDAESGIKALRIIETLIKDSNGIDNGGIISSDELSVFTEVEENIFETEYTYKILSSNGLIKLDISILDHSDNDVTYTYYVLKHVYDEASEIPYKFYVEPDDKKNFEKAYAVRYADENGVDNVQDNVILMNNDVYFDKYKLPGIAKITYWDEGEAEKELEGFGYSDLKISTDSSNEIFNDFKLFRNPNKKTTIKICIKNILGNELTKEYYILPENKTQRVNVIPNDNGTKINFKIEDIETISGKETFYQLKVFYGDQEIDINELSTTQMTTMSGVIGEYDFLVIDKKCNFIRSKGGYDSLYERSFRCNCKSGVGFSLDFKDYVIENLKFEFYEIEKTSDSLFASAVTLDSVFYAKYNGAKFNIESGLSEETENQELIFPTYEITAEPTSPTSGLYEISVNKLTEGNSYFNWVLFYRVKDSDEKKYKVSDLFTVSCGYRYEFGLDYYDPYGVYIDSIIIEEIDATERNTDDPTINIEVYDFEKSLCTARLSGDIYVEEGKLAENNYKFEYWYLKNNGVADREDYTEALIPELDKHTIELESKVKHYLTGSGWSWYTLDYEFNLPFVENDYYTLFYRVVYKSGEETKTTAIYKEVFNSRVNDIYSTELLDYRYSDSANNWYFFEEGTSMKVFDYYVISDSVKDNWYTYLEGYFQCESNKHKGFKVPVTYKNYIKVFPFSEVLDSHSYPIYIYNPYYTALFSESLDDDMNVLYKDAFEGMSGVQLYYDAPVLVETLYCYADMPSIEEWEARGISAKVEVLNPDAEKTFTTNYYPADPSIIESGCYYVVMVHFADGTKWCSTSKYKK